MLHLIKCANLLDKTKQKKPLDDARVKFKKGKSFTEYFEISFTIN